MQFCAGLLQFVFFLYKCFRVFITFSGNLLEASKNAFASLSSKPLNLQALESI